MKCKSVSRAISRGIGFIEFCRATRRSAYVDTLRFEVRAEVFTSEGKAIEGRSQNQNDSNWAKDDRLLVENGKIDLFDQFLVNFSSFY